MARRDWVIDGLIALAFILGAVGWSALMQASFDSHDAAQVASLVGGLGLGMLGGKVIALRHF